MAFVDKNLEKLKKISEEEYKKHNADEENYINNNDDLESFFLSTITNERLKTMAIEYDYLSNIVKVQVIRDVFRNTAKDIFEFSITEKGYRRFCEEQLKIDWSRKYNDSASNTYQGVPARIFAIMPPYKKHPLIVISTAKKPPKNIPTLTDIDEKKLKKALNGNFLIAGKSGAGKTYLLNYLLNKYCNDDRRIGIIQEFQEIFPPNDYTELLTTPPRVPGQTWNDLEFLTEQSNLMRYDMILVGEIKSSEAWPFVVNCSSGTKGGATIHGSSPQGALQRLRTLCLLARTNIQSAIVDNFIKDAVEYVIYVENMRVMEIKRVITVNNGKFALGDVEIDEE